MGVLWGMGYCPFKNMKLKVPPISALVCRQFLTGVWLWSSSTTLVDFYLILHMHRLKKRHCTLVFLCCRNKKKNDLKAAAERSLRGRNIGISRRCPANPLQIQSFRLSEGFSLSLSLGRGWVRGEQEGDGGLWHEKLCKFNPEHQQCTWCWIQRLDITVISIVGERIIQHRNIFN